MTNIPYNPANWMTDGRMYPVLRDNIKLLENGVYQLMSKGHKTLIGPNGAIEIILRATSEIVFSKLGADGRGVQ